MYTDYAGGGTFEMIQTTKQVQNTAHVEVESKPDWQHQTAHILIESGGFLWILGFAVLGAATFFRKKIQTWLGIEIRRVK